MPVSTCDVTGTIKDILTQDPLQGIEVKIKLASLFASKDQDEIYAISRSSNPSANETIRLRTDANGQVTFTVPQSISLNIEIPEAAVSGVISIPATATANLADLLVNNYTADNPLEE